MLASTDRRSDPEKEFKRAIGVAAAGLVSDGDTVALSSGSTVLELANQLKDRRLTVITNAIDVAVALIDAPDIELVVLGGVMLPSQRSLRGHLTELGMRELRADTVFAGVSAIDLETGFMTDNVPEIAVDRGLSMMGRRVVVLADASKFDRVAPGFMFSFDHVSTLITDGRISQQARESLERRGLQVIVAEAAASRRSDFG